MPALSRDDSLPSSHRFTLGRRNPEGGGPAGKAAKREEVVKVAEGHVLRAARTLARDEEVGRARASAARDLAEAIVVGINVVASGCRENALIGGSGNANAAICDWLERQQWLARNVDVRNRSSEHRHQSSTRAHDSNHTSTMIRAALFQSVRCASRSVKRTQLPVSRAIAPCLSVSSTRYTPSPRHTGIRCYSAPAGLSKTEVEGRIIDLLKNFDKVR